MKSRFRSENRKNTLKRVKINRRTKKMKEFEQLCKEFEQLDVVSYTSILAKNQLKFSRFLHSLPPSYNLHTLSHFRKTP
mgnify:CR=1 FL=1